MPARLLPSRLQPMRKGEGAIRRRGRPQQTRCIGWGAGWKHARGGRTQCLANLKCEQAERRARRRRMEDGRTAAALLRETKRRGGCVCATAQGAYRPPPLPRSSSRRGGGWRMRADRRRRDVLGAGHLPSHSALLLRNLSRPLPQMGAQHAWAAGGLVRPEDSLACWQAQPHDDARAILMATCGNDAESSPWTESTLLSSGRPHGVCAWLWIAVAERCVCVCVRMCGPTVMPLRPPTPSSAYVFGGVGRGGRG